MSRHKYRVNREIRARQVRVINPDGENLGVMPIHQAGQLASDAGLDLVEVAPNADPPVTRIMDFGKFMYEQSKRERQARKSQKQVEVKEIQLRPKTTEHHIKFKVKKAREWLQDGNKVKVRLRFRGREITYPEVGIEQLQTVAEQLSDVSAIEQAPKLDGRAMLMILAPKK